MQQHLRSQQQQSPWQLLTNALIAIAKVNCGFNNFLHCVRLTSTRRWQQILCYVASNCIAAESMPGTETPQCTSPSTTIQYFRQARSAASKIGDSLWNVSTSVRSHLHPSRKLTWGQQQSGRPFPPALVTPAHQCSTDCFKHYSISPSSNWRRH